MDIKSSVKICCKSLSVFGFLLFLSFSPQITTAQTHGFSTDKKITQFSIDVWSTEHGLPSNSLLALYQTKQGYLWMTSFQGLFRFDGVHFDEYTTKSEPAVASNLTSRIFEHPNGTLYIGSTNGGILTFKDNSFGRLENFNVPVETVLFDSNSHAWVGTRNRGVFEFENGKFKAFDKIDELNNVDVFFIYKDKKENIWFATEGNGLVVLKKNGEHQVFTTKDGLSSNKVRTVFQDRKSQIWIGTNDGLCVYNQKEIKPISELKDMPVTSILEDKNGSIWVSTEKGIVRINGATSEIEQLTEKTGLPGKNVQGLCLDREGSIWFSTYRSGLGRIREGKFSNYTTRTGLSSKSISGICEIKKETFLTLTDVGAINKIENHQISKFEFKTKLPNDRLKHITKDSRGNVLVSTYSGLLVISPNGKEKLYHKGNGFPGNQIRVSMEDHLGNIWVGTKTHGLIKMSPNGNLSFFNKDNSDLGSNFIMSLRQTKDKKLLVGTMGGGVFVIDTEKGFQVTSYTDELSTKSVFSAYADNDNVLWVGTLVGLNRIENGKTTKFTTENGLPIDVVFDILEDDNNNLWLSSNAGVIRIDKNELNDLAKKGTGKITSSTIYGKSDGMNSQECTGAVFAIKSSDGILMFPTLDGISYINPTQISINQVKPPVKVGNLLVDNNSINVYSKINFKPGKQRFSFSYTALSLIAPEKVFFKYKLENYDEDWIDAGTERQAIYTRLPYGEYTFRVKASNNDGIWNEEGASLAFEIAPYFYETKLFYATIILLIGIIITTIYNYRIRSIKKQNEELESLVKERTYEIHSQNEELMTQRDKIEEQKDRLEEQNNSIEEQNSNLELAYNDISMLSKIGQEITATLDFDQLNHILYENVNNLMKADGFGMGIYNKKQDTLDFADYIENGEQLPFLAEKLSAPKASYAIKCFREKKSFLINDLDLETEHKNISNEEDAHGLVPHSFIYVPLLFENKAIGVITSQSFEVNSYVERHITILETLASYISIALINTKSYEIIQNKNEQITDSIKYAERIQKAVLPSFKQIQNVFDDSFVFFSPKDIVSGDFYWFNQVGNKTFVAVSDCTGHGVPGAFMSMIGSALLNEIVNKEQTFAPSEILTKLHKKVRHSLKQGQTDNRDGMDIALCLIENIDDNNVEVIFSGAKRPLYYTENNVLREIKGNKKSIGGYQKEAERFFKEEQVTLPKGEAIYLFSDGIIDQNSPNRKRFGTPTFKKILNESIQQPLEIQKNNIVTALQNHQDGDTQRDDIVVIGIKI